MSTSHPPSDQPTTGDKIRYQIDRFLSWSPAARFIGLFGLSLVLVLICATLAKLVLPSDAEKPFDFLEAMWWSMTRVADTGTMVTDEGTLVRFVAVLATLCGLMVVALLIGLVSSTIGEKIDDLRKGKSPVIDEGHTLVLGWGEKVFTILRELRTANENQKSAAVVILSEQDKETVENAIRERMGDMKTTRVIVRQGSPFAPSDLKKVGAGRARSIIVLAAEEAESVSSGKVDMAAIKTLLALRRIPGALSNNHVTIELMEEKRRPVLELLGSGGVEVVAMESTLSRMMVQTARQRGLAEVYRDLLSYDGSEFYFRAFPEAVGQTFGSLQWKMKDAVVVGVRRVVPGGKPQSILNPPDDFVLEQGDELLVIAEDDDTFSLTAQHRAEVPADFQPPPPVEPQPEKLLICGMAQKLGDMLKEFDNYVLPGSEAWLMPGKPKGEVSELLREHAQDLKNLKLRYMDGDPTMPDALEKVVTPELSVVLLLADDEIEAEEADAKTVISVLLLRELFQSYPGQKPRIISEILDPRTKDLLEQDYGADFVVSSEITSMLLAQVSERRDLNAVFADLFDSDGNEIYLKNAAHFATLGKPVSWLVVQKVARLRKEVALGFMRKHGGPVINPPQNQQVQFTAGDRIIVVAEDGTESVSMSEETVAMAPSPARAVPALPMAAQRLAQAVAAVGIPPPKMPQAPTSPLPRVNPPPSRAPLESPTIPEVPVVQPPKE